jgi:hypothetical protein
MTQNPAPRSADPGPADDANVDQAPGAGSGLPQSPPAGGGHEREVGVTAAVDRGPAETTSDGDPVPDNPHASLDDREPARSTDDL